jgi:putative endonuclease
MIHGSSEAQEAMMGWSPELEWEDAPAAPTRAQTGELGEALAAAYLEERGWEILDRRARWRDGELDVVAGRWVERYGERVRQIIVVEVKARRDTRRARPEASVGARKRRTVARLAQAWCARHGVGRVALRLDVIAVDLGGAQPQITHFEGAFGEGGAL